MDSAWLESDSQYGCQAHSALQMWCMRTYINTVIKKITRFWSPQLHLSASSTVVIKECAYKCSLCLDPITTIHSESNAISPLRSNFVAM